MARPDGRLDVLVIGGGVVGCAVLRELARLDASVGLVERGLDVGEGTSKANSAIVHTGFDAPPGTLEARLLAEARGLWPDVIDDLHIPYLQTGAVMVATDRGEMEAIEREVVPKAERNGVTLQRLTGDEIRAAIPTVSPAARGGVLVAGEGVIDPFWTTRAYAENAIRNGARVWLGEGITAVTPARDEVMVETDAGRVLRARLVVNAAGLWSDEVARLAGDTSFRITPRKGQFIITEEEHGIGQIVLPVPNRVSKGILVTPIVFGGTMLGPTAEDVADKMDLGVTPEGLAEVRAGVRKLVPSIADAGSVRQFAGLRAVSDTGAYVVRQSSVSRRLVHVAGIRSTGLSASPALARHVAGIARDELGPGEKRGFDPTLPEFLADARADEGDVVCLCRTITRGEIAGALGGPLPATTLDAVKRRTGAMLGDCQGNICIPRIVDLIAARSGTSPELVPKNVPGSSPVCGAVGDGRR